MDQFILIAKVAYSSLVKKQNNNDGDCHPDYLNKSLAHTGIEARLELLPNKEMA